MASPPEVAAAAATAQARGQPGARTLRTDTPAQAPGPRPGPRGPRLGASRGPRPPAPRRVRLKGRARPDAISRRPGRPPASASAGNAPSGAAWGAGPARSPARRVPGAPPHPGGCGPKATGLARAGQRPPALRQPGLIPSARPRRRAGRLARPQAGPPGQASAAAPRRSRPPSASRPPQGAPLASSTHHDGDSQCSLRGARGRSRGWLRAPRSELLLGLLVPAARPDWADGAAAHRTESQRRVARPRGAGGLRRGQRGAGRWLLRKVRGARRGGASANGRPRWRPPAAGAGRGGGGRPVEHGCAGWGYAGGA